MIKTIKVKLDVIESMIYFWQATSEKEKVGEIYINDISQYDDMNLIYDSEFDDKSVRTVLSAISNRELLNSESKKSRKFWNNNMWMMEDLEYTNMMVTPVKVLNLDSIVDELNENNNSDYEELEVVFVPWNHEVCKIEGNKLIVNFFRVKPDLFDETKVTIEDMDIKEFIKDKLIEIVK
ncbi:TDE2712 family protein [Tepidibacter sp. Z1-5]|uniref:TDE2712 family protein n=1 Tax=Tepidibacter sp. Z1-5 TaxID=3134138 RepID=UPI0030C40A80